MLATLVKIGEQLLEGQGIWARLTVEPKYNDREEKNRWICPILFDCVDGEIKILFDRLERFYPGESAIKYRYVNSELWGRRGNKCAITVEPKNFSMLAETFFGKEGRQQGSIQEAIKKHNRAFCNSTFANVVDEINKVLNNKRENLDLKEILQKIGFGKLDEVVLFYSLVRSSNFFKGETKSLFEVPGFEEFIISKFGSTTGGKIGLDYVTGIKANGVVEADFTGRFNLNKIFQNTALNFASNFKDFSKSFQAHPNTIAALDKASGYVLDRWKKPIAGTPHLVLPNYPTKNLEGLNLNEIELFLDSSFDLLFGANALDTQIVRDLPDLGLFWINYIGYETNLKKEYYKTISLIKDVNSLHLKSLVEAFKKSQVEFQDYIGGKYAFNLQSIYFIIPVRDGKKEKKNEALGIFKDILEQRKIDPSRLFKHFINLILCHWYGRYKAFPNIHENDFDFAIKDAVFKYSALFYSLKKLNLMDMEDSLVPIQEQKAATEFQQRINDFFAKMSYSPAEKSLFYLGRVLSSVAYAQYKKGHESKPVLNKINFNGMDESGILRLSLDLAEKARQYNIHTKTDWDFARFRESFTEKNWHLTPEQNVFYLMAGYSFGLTKSEN